MASGPDDTTSPRDGRRDGPDAPGRVPPVDTDRAPGQARSNRHRATTARVLRAQDTSRQLARRYQRRWNALEPR